MKLIYLSPFTPSLMMPEILEQIFVQRQNLAEQIIELIRESATTPSKHYTLLIGPRGIGKTHLISLIYHRICKMADLRDRLLIAWVNEEEWGISSFLDLVVRILKALEKEYNDSELAKRIESLYQLTADHAESAASELLKETIGNRTLLLLIENLDEVFAGLDDQGQKQLRSYLQENSFCTIVATAQSLFNGVKLQTSPFYGFFRIRHLKDLTLDEAVELLAKVAKVQGDRELESFIRTPTGRDRIQAVHYLAGGNPRIYIIFSAFLTRKSLDDLVEAFMAMLDDLTPYYQDRMKCLSPQQRKIVDLLCDRRYAVTVKEISQRCFITHQTASSQLKKLLEMGYVRSESIGRESYYELREVLMRFCLEVKKQRGEPISLIVDLLRSWYTREELKQQWESCLTLSKDVERFDKTSIHPSLAESLRQTSLEQEYLRQALQPIDTEEDPRVAAYIKEFKALIDQQDFMQALRLAEKLVLVRGDAEDWLKQGTCLYELKRYEEAIASYKKALVTNPVSDMVWYNLGLLILGTLDRLEEAIDSFDKALTINPENENAWYFRGVTLGKLGRLKEAIDSFDKALNINPDDDDTWYFHGSILNDLGRWEEAIASFDKVLAINPEHDVAWSNRGILLSKLRRWEEAIDSFDKALTINPDNDDTWYFQGITLFQLKRLEEAIASYDQALVINPEYESAWYLRGGILSYLGRLEEAIASYEQALAINPNDDDTWYLRGKVFYKLGNFEEAVSSYDKTLAINPDYDDAWNNQGMALCNLDRLEEAIACFDKALAINPDYDDAWNNRGITLWKLGRLEEAIACFDKVLAINPDYDNAWNNRGKILGYLKRLEEAIACFDKVLAINPARKETWYYKGALLNLLGHYEEALISCNKAIELGANDWNALFSRAMAIMGLNWSEGITALEDAINRTKTKDKLLPGYTNLIIYILFKSVQDSTVWKSRILPIIKLYENHQAVSELGQGIVGNIPLIMSEMVSDKAAQTWLEVWQEIVGDAKEFEIPLRLLKTAVEYKVKKGDRRVLLELPIEERKLLTEEIKIEEAYKK
ncbi:tetratricopeptide repeat protein [Aerosakkonemataceae cyanobacterium BLCC-F50]|uniref:Tetratricopeptide repeat protein n=1 Tax=Floridaenema flaviceps BLCC-F50 TaxID=3153642 RepID=A0ABV4Y0L3_9CYAN